MSGRVLGQDGQALAGASIYAFTTIRPGSYPNSRNPGYVHFEVSATGAAPRVYEIVFEGDPFISPAFREQARAPFGGVAIELCSVAPLPHGRGYV